MNHIGKYEINKPSLVHMLNTALYVGNIFPGSQSVDEAYNLSHDAVSILKKDGFIFGKLKSNATDLETVSEQNVLNIGTKDQLKILGLNWNPGDDLFIVRG